MHKSEANEIATGIALEVIHHIEVQYPEALQSVPKSARESIKNKIINQVVLNIIDLEFKSE